VDLIRFGGRVQYADCALGLVAPFLSWRSSMKAIEALGGGEVSREARTRMPPSAPSVIRKQTDDSNEGGRRSPASDLYEVDLRARDC